LLKKKLIENKISKDARRGSSAKKHASLMGPKTSLTKRF